MTAFDVTDPRGRVLHKHIMQALREAVVLMQASVLAMHTQHRPHYLPTRHSPRGDTSKITSKHICSA
jgi:hypothetical protein